MLKEHRQDRDPLSEGYGSLPPLVIQLQMAAMDGTSSVSSLLLKAKLVATKLGLSKSEIAYWISHELDGYAGSTTDLPSYRCFATEPVALNPIRGEIPVIVGHPVSEVLRKALYEMPFPNPLPEIEALIASGDVSNLRIQFGYQLQQLVAELTGLNFRFQYRFGSGQLTAVVEAVRSRTMQWALDLEAAGVVGTDFQFTLVEKAAAVTITNHFSNNNIGNIGDVTTGGQVINTQTISNTIEIGKVAAFLNELGLSIGALPVGIQSAIESPVQALNLEIKSAKPSQSKIQKALISIKGACESAGGNLIASGVLALIGPLFG